MMTKYLVGAVLVSTTFVLLLASCSTGDSSSTSGTFERPVRLSVDDAPLNTKAKKWFLSPAIFDVDGDGRAELVIGDLMGGIGVYANLNTSVAGDAVWGARKEFKDPEGNPIETPNW